MLNRNILNSNVKEIIDSGVSSTDTKSIHVMLPQVEQAVGLVARLRGPNGCPWDREQDHLTLRQYLIEEAYEVLEILDQYQVQTDPKENAKDLDKSKSVPPNGSFSKENSLNLKEELGDLLLQVLLHSRIAEERGDFNFGDVAQAMAEKLVYRHPHVFKANDSSLKADSSDEVLTNWETLKKKDGRKSILDGLPKSLPSLQRAARIGEKAKNVGFDWQDWKGSFDKVEEEVGELKSAIKSENKIHIEEEIGDLFFSICNLSRHLKIQPEDAHRKALEKFESRFRKLENECEKQGIEMQNASLEKLDEIWNQIKKQ